MNKIYAFSKVAVNGKYYRSLYGEVQSNFNINYVLDGTKDNAKVEVYNYDKEAIKPYTIIFLECGASAELSWFIVSRDKVERYETEENASGYYKHSIDLLGCFELLNARDLTNSGFNIDRYTYEQFCNRLASLSDFELPITFNLSPYIDKDQVVRYLKTYQNYSPMSAIRELFDGVNCIAKMYFETTTDSNGVYLTNAVIKAYSKSGNDKQTIDMSNFDDSNETTNIDKESYGTRVVSNAENVVSADEVRYPSQFAKMASCNEDTLNFANAFLQLPSNIYKVKSLSIHLPTQIQVYYHRSGTQVVALSNDLNSCITLDSFKDVLDNTIGKLDYQQLIDVEYTQEDLENIYNQFFVSEYCVKTIENGGYYSQLENGGTWHGDHRNITTTGLSRVICLNDEVHKNTNPMSPYDSTIWWKQGENKIYLKPLGDVNTISPTVHVSPVRIGTVRMDNTTYPLMAWLIVSNARDINRTMFSCIYTPMSDLKIKVENENEQNDSNMYNQNGKLVDSGSVSKLINSHAIEISSDEKVRYKHFFKFSDIYQIGQKVKDGNDVYVINNVSIDLIDNDDFGYFYACQFAMTKATACKSTLISANTNIRDYQCPQQNNVKRVQLYRDYIEFSYGALENTETPYLGLNQIFNFTSSNYGFNDNHSCLVKVQADEFIDENDNPNGNFYYYMVCTKYNLNKQFIEICDFLDNNIIGYESGVLHLVLKPIDLIGWAPSYVNTPISYVDSYGELNGIELLFVDETQLYNAYDSVYGDDSSIILSKFVSITESTYEYALNNGYDIKITEDNYKKDGLEVPLFEYSCQVGDSNGIYFGQDFLKGIVPNGDYTYQVERIRTYFDTLPITTIPSGTSSTFSFVNSDLIGYDLYDLSIQSILPALSGEFTYELTFDNTTGTFYLTMTNSGGVPLHLFGNAITFRYKYMQTLTRSDVVYKYRVVDRQEIINQENATLYTSQNDNSCTYSYDETTKKLTITLASSVNLEHKDIVLFAYKYDSEGIKSTFMFAINDFKLSGTRNTIELFVNNWKLR